MGKQDRRPAGVTVRPALEADLPAADRIVRVAFGTATGVPDPEQFFGDADIIKNRWKASDNRVFVAESGGEIVSAIAAAKWGSFGFFGPFGVRPDLWDRGIAKKALASVMDCFNDWGIRLAGLFTMPHSPKHIGLYQHFGFKPQYLTAVMTKHLPDSPLPEKSPEITTYASLPDSQKNDCRQACRHLTDAVYSGLDLTVEIEAIETDRLGDTLLIFSGSALTGFAACHLGPDTEAGSDTCYVKFAAARPDAFEALLAACAAYARQRSVSKLEAGVNTARREAYDMMLGSGFRHRLLGVAMLKPDVDGFNRPGVFVMDDWR